MPVDPIIPEEPLAGFNELLGMRFDEIGPDRVVARLEVRDDHRQPYGLVHGGVYCTMAEAAASYGAAHAVGPERGSVGQSNHTDFLRATRDGVLVATATPIHVGRAVQLWNVDIVDGDGRLVAQSKVRMFNVGG